MFFREDITFDNNWEDALKGKLPAPDDLLSWDNQRLLQEITNNTAKYSNMDLSTSAPNMKYKVKLKENDLTFNNNQYKVAKFGGKQFMYWGQADTDMVAGNLVQMWIPYFVYIPLVSADGTNFTVLHINYEEYLELDWNGTSYKYKVNIIRPTWSVVNINRIPDQVKNAADTEISKLTGLSSNNSNEIKAHIYAQHMAINYTNKLFLNDGSNTNDNKNQWRVRRSENNLGTGLTNPDFWNQVDKFAIFIKIREENKEVE